MGEPIQNNEEEKKITLASSISSFLGPWTYPSALSTHARALGPEESFAYSGKVREHHVR